MFQQVPGAGHGRGARRRDRGLLIVPEAFGGAAGAGTVSSYRLDRVGELTTADPTVPTTETAAR